LFGRRTHTPYDAAFFAGLAKLATASADVVVPLLLDNLSPYSVRSVVDVGCGTGAWLRAFQRHGVEDILGIDGEYLAKQYLVIPEDRVMCADLSSSIEVGRRFDLAISLEVGEHLPESSARGFVETLTRLSDVILFSAAIPRQGGPGHVNEQWQDYWRGLFRDLSYRVADPIRPRIWHDERVMGYYRQNILLYVAQRRAAELPQLEFVAPDRSVDLVHPQVYKSQKALTLGPTVRKLPSLIAASVRKHVRRRSRK